MFPECSCICACVHASFEQTLLARYLQVFVDGIWPNFHQGHDGVKYAPKCTFWPCSLSHVGGGIIVSGVVQFGLNIVFSVSNVKVIIKV